MAENAIGLGSAGSLTLGDASVCGTVFATIIIEAIARKYPTALGTCLT